MAVGPSSFNLRCFYKSLFFLLFFLLPASFFSPLFIQAHSGTVLKIPQGEVFYFTKDQSNGDQYLFVRCFNRSFPFFKTGTQKEVGVFIAVDLAQPLLTHTCQIEKKDSSEKRTKEPLTVQVVSGDFKTQELNVPRKMVDLDPPTLKRVKLEKSAVDQLWNQSISEKLWEGNFILPVNGEPRGSFGLRRVFNGQPRSPHTGEDFSAPMGEKVLSSNGGIVKLVGDHFFSGKSIFIDHGLGVYTMYFHLSEILVKKGDSIKKGQEIGRVGATGRATGPHLHWGLRMNNARVNPMSLTNFSSVQPLE